jgi:hypothetical protein
MGSVALMDASRAGKKRTEILRCAQDDESKNAHRRRGEASQRRPREGGRYNCNCNEPAGRRRYQRRCGDATRFLAWI